MKRSVWIAALLIAIIVLIGVIYFSSSSDLSFNSEFQLEVKDITASSEGKVSFNVSLIKGESRVLESVVLNNTRYSWSDGSSDSPTILNGESKYWSLDVGSLINGSNIEVVVEAPPVSGTGNVIVNSSISDEPKPDELGYVYDTYGCVGLFDEGIHILATSQDPRNLSGEFPIVNDYWQMLFEHETTEATEQDFITILLSRGDKSTGGYAINIESFSWLESYPVKFRFNVNFTDPGERVIVTEALTNPTVLVPIGKLTPGEYNIEVYVTMYILNFNDEGETVYTPIMTFAPIVWTQTLTVSSIENHVTSTIFNVTLNGNDSPDLTVQINLSDGLTEAEAIQIAETAFIYSRGEDVLRQLDTITYDNQQIAAHYIWGYDENDMGHVLDLKADLDSLQIIISNCR